jgi:hypothetical protein
VAVKLFCARGQPVAGIVHVSVAGLTTIEVNEGELMQLVSGRKRPANRNAFEHVRLNINDLLGLLPA